MAKWTHHQPESPNSSVFAEFFSDTPPPSPPETVNTFRKLNKQTYCIVVCWFSIFKNCHLMYKCIILINIFISKLMTHLRLFCPTFYGLQLHVSLRIGWVYLMLMMGCYVIGRYVTAIISLHSLSLSLSPSLPVPIMFLMHWWHCHLKPQWKKMKYNLNTHPLEATISNWQLVFRLIDASWPFVSPPDLTRVCPIIWPASEQNRPTV